MNLRDCSHDGWDSICTDELQWVVDVVLQEHVPAARVEVRFYDGIVPCVETWLGEFSFTPGVTQTLNSTTRAPELYARYQVSEGDGPRTTVQRCELPATTNKLAVEIFNVRNVRAPVLVKEFETTYTFAAPRPAGP